MNSNNNSKNYVSISIGWAYLFHQPVHAHLREHDNIIGQFGLVSGQADQLDVDARQVVELDVGQVE